MKQPAATTEQPAATTEQASATTEQASARADAPCLLVLNAAEGVIQYLIARVEAAPPAPGTRPALHSPAGVRPAPAAEAQSALPPMEDARGFFSPALGGTLRLLCAHDWHAPSQGAELLAPALAHAFERLSIRPGDIGRIACVRGPGSFTGLRLVLATAAGLARTTGALQGGIDYLTLLANGAAHAWATWNNAPVLAATREPQPPLAPAAAEENQPRSSIHTGQEYRSPGASPQPPANPVYWVLTHARRNLVHAQVFTHTPGGAVPADDILVFSLEEAARQIAASPAPCLVLGSGATKNQEALRALLADASHAPAMHPGGVCAAGVPTAPLFLPPSFDQPHPMRLLRAAALCGYARQDIDPLYARPCDAEENLDHIAASLRIDPKEARAQLAKLTTAQG